MKILIDFDTKSPEGRITSERCTTVEGSQHKRGRKCLLCPLMSNTSSVSVGGKKIQCDGGDCRSRNVIYLFACRLCQLCYVGKTGQMLRKRVNGHRNCGVLEEGVGDPQALQRYAQRVHNQGFQDVYVYQVWIFKQVGDPGRLLHEELDFIHLD